MKSRNQSSPLPHFASDLMNLLQATVRGTELAHNQHQRGATPRPATSACARPLCCARHVRDHRTWDVMSGAWLMTARARQLGAPFTFRSFGNRMPEALRGPALGDCTAALPSEALPFSFPLFSRTHGPGLRSQDRRRVCGLRAPHPWVSSFLRSLGGARGLLSRRAIFCAVIGGRDFVGAQELESQSHLSTCVGSRALLPQGHQSEPGSYKLPALSQHGDSRPATGGNYSCNLVTAGPDHMLGLLCCAAVIDTPLQVLPHGNQRRRYRRVYGGG
jgi:hypothetical protein